VVFLFPRLEGRRQFWGGRSDNTTSACQACSKCSCR